jgi:tetratricopeptide (TPR) repeat protein
VIGKDVAYFLLQALAEVSDEQLRQGLVDLQAGEFLYEVSVFPDVEYTFKHALTHEVAYGGVLQERRRSLHACIVEAMERLYADRLPEHLERLAQHALRGEVWEKAVRYCHQAGAKALERSANRQAVECFDQVLTAMKHVPTTRETLEQGVDVRFELRNALHALGEFERLVDSLREAESLAERLGDQRRMGLAAGFRAFYFTLIGDHDGSIDSARRAFAIAEATGDLGVKVVSINYLGLAHFYRGDYQKAIEFHAQNIELLEGDLMRQRFELPAFPAVLCRSYFAWSHAELGSFAEGSMRGQDGAQLAEALKHPFSIIWAEFSLGYLYLRQGKMDSALRSLERGFMLCRENNNMPFVFPLIATLLGGAYLYSERLSEALPILKEALQAGIAMRLALFRPVLLGFLAEAHFRSGLLQDARQYLDAALQLSQERKERGWEAWIWKLIGEVESHPDLFDSRKAEKSYLHALTIATALAMRPLAAHCHAGLGKLYKQAGQRKHAQEHLTVATTMFRELNMRFWLEKAEVALRNL